MFYHDMEKTFDAIATKAARLLGRAYTFIFATLLILMWVFSGPYFGYSEQWSLAVNTGTTIVTFLMVFLIQNTQNRDARAMHLKLDELIRVSKARNELMQIEAASQREIENAVVEVVPKKRGRRPRL